MSAVWDKWPRPPFLNRNGPTKKTHSKKDKNQEKENNCLRGRRDILENNRKTKIKTIV